MEGQLHREELIRLFEGAARSYAEAADQLEAATDEDFRAAHRRYRVAEREVLACALSLGHAEGAFLAPR